MSLNGIFWLINVWINMPFTNPVKLRYRSVCMLYKEHALLPLRHNTTVLILNFSHHHWLSYYCSIICSTDFWNSFSKPPVFHFISLNNAQDYLSMLRIREIKVTFSGNNMLKQFLTFTYLLLMATGASSHYYVFKRDEVVL